MKTQRLNFTILLAAGYALVLGVFAYFTYTSSQDMDATSLIINGIMLALAAAVYWHAGTRLNKVRRVSNNLKEASLKMEADYIEKKVMLWNTYKESGSYYLFKDESPCKEYAAYIMEMKRLEVVSNEGFKCQIENYINKELIDKTAKKSNLNLVPGVMTGLGILGTFVGLSLGLQNFNTGSSAEIADSIAPLMSGIKVAFHTSIFGMILSLVFNYAYKGALAEAYDSLDEFIRMFGWYVSPNPENDYYNQMLTVIPNRIGEQMATIMQPHFDKMSETLSELSDSMLENQVRGVGEIVDVFLSEMNKSLGKNFEELGDILGQTCTLQKENITYMQTILEKVGTMTTNIQEINELSGKTIETLSTYIEDVEGLQTVINDSYMSVQLQLEENKKQEEKMHQYMDMLVKYEQEISKSTDRHASDMEKLLTLFAKLEGDLAKYTEDNLNAMSKQSETFVEKLSEIVKEQIAEVKVATTTSMDELKQQAVDHNRSIADAAKELIQEISNISNTTSDNMNNATKNLSEVSNQLGDKLNSSLEKTFYVFDSELEKIAQRLSGTIAEVDSTTGRVPQVVAAAYEGMQEVLQEMQANMVSYVDVVSQMQEQLMEVIEQLNNKTNEDSEE